jgi:ABC-type lipoprotein release transport system permease subunit
MFKTLRAHLADNRGDENISKMIWVAIVFVVGAILLIMVSSAFQGPIKEWYENVINDWFKQSTGAYGSAADNRPTVG